jgi:hypothetical protein
MPIDYTDSLGFNKNSAGFPANYTDRVSVIEIDLDFAKIAAARVAAGAAALASGDTLVIGTLPKGSYVVAAAATLVRAEGAAATISVGVTGAATVWANAFNLNTTVGTTVGVTNGARYQTADTGILLTLNSNDVDAARAKVSLAVVNMGADLGSIPNVT